MRMPTVYERYLWRMLSYYKIKNLKGNERIFEELRFYSKLYCAERDLYSMYENTNIPKSTMKWLSELKNCLILEELSSEFRNDIGETVLLLDEMYKTLVENKERYFLCEWTLTKEGRRVMKEYFTKIPSVSDIQPPVRFITNFPDSVVYKNKFFTPKYELAVTANGHICVDNGSGNTEFINYSESFFDNISSILQWENVQSYFHKFDREKDENTDIYQTFENVLVEADWQVYTLNLQTAAQDNPFIKVLQLVWEEFGELFKEKNLVLPWFKFL